MRALILAPFSASQLSRLRRRVDVVYESWLATGRLQNPDELGTRLEREGFEALVIEADFVFEEVFAAAPRLRFVGVCRNALNQVDVESATAHGVAVSHARGRNTNAVAEMTIGLMIALARRIPEAHHLVSGGAWRDPALGYRSLRGREVGGSTVGVVGFGQIGREVARKCLALGARVVAFDPFVPERQMRILGARRAATLAAVAKASDFITLHVAETEKSRRLIDAAFLARMKDGAFLINTSAGGVVDPHALVEALNAGKLGGAAVDVFEGHPLPASSPLLSTQNLLLTPHIAGATTETVERHSRMMADEIEHLVAGQRLRHCVNPAYLQHG